ncbi:unnamed protein product [Leptosia nina]|uniref:Uncharacterized protein n=1 Tax=Leptosia nina TaxID=320188 RepID=A0AAV1JWC2_9NEOP
MKSGVSFISAFWEDRKRTMFYKVIVLSWGLACVFAAPPVDVVPLEKQQPTVIPIVSQSDELEPNGTYHFSYETGNGIKREEIAYEKVVPKAQGRSDSNEGGESDESDEIHVQQGSYSYTGPDGIVYTVRYIADENGFQPIGDHLPRVPGVSSSSSAEKSGRALKDSVESASSPQQVETKVAAPVLPNAPEKPVEQPASPVEVAKPEEAEVPSEVEAKSAPESESAPAEEPMSSTEAVSESSASKPAASPTTSSVEDAQSIVEDAQSTVADVSTTESSSATTESEVVSSTAAVEKETEAPVSSAVTEQVTEGSGEQPTSTASVLEELSTSAPEAETSTAIISDEQPNSTEAASSVAPEQQSTTESGVIESSTADVSTASA